MKTKPPAEWALKKAASLAHNADDLPAIARALEEARNKGLEEAAQSADRESLRYKRAELITPEVAFAGLAAEFRALKGKR
jgi:hypothetical protein